MSQSRMDTDMEIQSEYVIDADFHFEPTPESLLEYIDDERVQELVEDNGLPPAGSNTMQRASVKYEDPDPKKGIRSLGQARNIDVVEEAKSSVGFDQILLTPGWNKVNSWPKPRVKTAICRAYNDLVLDAVASTDEDIKAMLITPQWDVDAALEELERHGDNDDVVAAYGWTGPYEMWGMSKYDALYDSLDALNLPLVLHHSADFHRYTPEGLSRRTWVEIGWVMPCTKAIMNTANMIMTGVFDKYPDLNVVYYEAGANWLPFLAHRLDETYPDHPEDLRYTERMYDADQAYLERRPSEYVFDNIYCGTQPLSKPDDPEEFRKTLELARADETFIYSSDWPHHTFDPPGWVSSVLGEDYREEVMHETARGVFRL